MEPRNKWKFAIGTTSRVPDSGGLHYLIIDIDTNEWSNNLIETIKRANNIVIQNTTNGWHIYTDIRMSFHALIPILKFVRADPTWIAIGKKRGYYFLADKSQLCFPWPVEHMVLHNDKKKAQDSKKP